VLWDSPEATVACTTKADDTASEDRSKVATERFIVIVTFRQHASDAPQRNPGGREIGVIAPSLSANPDA
jgi:hypothetical protein